MLDTPVYLDNAATTRVLPEVAAAMARVLSEDYGNPSSRHRFGLTAETHMRLARRTIAEHIGVPAEGVVFTSGGTEANALGLLGALRCGKRGRHVLISAIEHPSLLRNASLLQREGFEVETIPVTVGGRVDPKRFERQLRPDTSLVAVMHVNNETGIIQPVDEISRLAKRKNPDCLVLVDAVQSLPVLPVRTDELGADLLTLSAHKIHGPKGAGCLVAAPHVKLAPLWEGGDQEGTRRPGTENVSGVIGFSAALTQLGGGSERLTGLCHAIQRCVTEARSEAYPVGDPAHRAPHILTMAVPGVSTEVLINLLESRGVCASSGSACHSRRTLRSHVLAAMALPTHHGVARFSLSWTTSDEEVARATEIIGAALRAL